MLLTSSKSFGICELGERARVDDGLHLDTTSYGALGGSGDGGGADGGKLQTAPASYSSKSHEPPEAVTCLHSWISVLCSFFQR